MLWQYTFLQPHSIKLVNLIRSVSCENQIYLLIAILYSIPHKDVRCDAPFSLPVPVRVCPAGVRRVGAPFCVSIRLPAPAPADDAPGGAEPLRYRVRFRVDTVWQISPTLKRASDKKGVCNVIEVSVTGARRVLPGGGFRCF